MTENSRNQNRTTEWLLEILVRLQDRGVDITATPLSPEAVRAAVTIGDEIINEELTADGLQPLPDVGDGSDETFELLDEYELPAGGLARVEMIIQANEAVAYRDFIESTAETHATTWNEYMNRGNARGTLGRFAEALEDYAVAESLAERRRDRKMIRENKVRLLQQLAELDTPDA